MSNQENISFSNNNLSIHWKQKKKLNKTSLKSLHFVPRKSFSEVISELKKQKCYARSNQKNKKTKNRIESHINF